MVYDFATCYQRGVADEARLDAYFRRYYAIQPVSRAQQRRGIDRRFRRDTLTFGVEYKSDRTAASTGNAFVEVVSVRKVGRREKRGWVFTSRADVLIYYLPQHERVYWLLFRVVREYLPVWQRKCESRAVENETYHTVGLIVPLRRFDEVCAEQTETCAVLSLAL